MLVSLFLNDDLPAYFSGILTDMIQMSSCVCAGSIHHWSIFSFPGKYINLGIGWLGMCEWEEEEAPGQ